METWYQCYTQHFLTPFFPSGRLSLANAAHSPQALPFAEANGKHIRHLPFASALKAIGEMANGE
jgi:hypothetical protein